MARGIGLVSLLLLSTVAPAQLKRVQYSMEFDMETGTSAVEMKLPEGKTAKKFWMSAWVPGDYQLFNYGTTVSEISFFREGEEVKFSSRDGLNGFVGEGEWDSVKYRVKMSKGNFSDNLLIQKNLIFVSPAGVLGFADGMLSEPVEVVAKGPAGWDFQGAIKGKGGSSGQVMQAKDHETIGDSPFLFAPEILRSEFRVADKPHYFVAVGNTAGVDVEAFGAVAELAVEQGLVEFGELPYDQYTFFGLWASFPAGLEHGTSCRLGMWGKDPRQMAGLIFHEYVHTFNIKHIRPESLRPIDPLNAPKVESLWWLEGVTDYFADLWMLRAGLLDEAGFLNSMRQTYMATQRNQNYSKISAKESSLRVWETSGSQGFGGVSYYTKGKLIGFLMDVNIRSRRSGDANLGEVIKTLYQECEGEQGYSETRISELVTKISGFPADSLVDPSRNLAAGTQVNWTDTILKAGLVERNGRLVKNEEMDEAAKAVFESFFGKSGK